MDGQKQAMGKRFPCTVMVYGTEQDAAQTQDMTVAFKSTSYPCKCRYSMETGSKVYVFFSGQVIVFPLN